MGLWLVQDVPSWVVALVAIAGLPLAMIGLDHLLHQHLPHRRLGRYNVVTGVIVSVVGVAYGIMVGQCVVSLWDKYSDGTYVARMEAANLTALAQNSHVFGAEVERQMSEEAARYDQLVVQHWAKRVNGVPDPAEKASLDALGDIITSLEPANDAQRAYILDGVARLAQARDLRQRALDQASDQQIPGMMWFAFLAATTGVLMLCLLFGLDDTIVRRSLLTLVTVVVATNLYVVVEMNYPYHGSFAVSSESYQDAANDLRG